MIGRIETGQRRIDLIEWVAICRARVYAPGEVHDALHAFAASLRHDVSRAELAGELLPLLVVAYCDDPLMSGLARCELLAATRHAGCICIPIPPC